MALRFLEFHVLALVLPRQLPGYESGRQKNEECKTRNVGPILGNDHARKEQDVADGSRGDPKYGLSPKPSRSKGALDLNSANTPMGLRLSCSVVHHLRNWHVAAPPRPAEPI